MHNPYGYWSENGRVEMTEAEIAALLDQRLAAVKHRSWSMMDQYRKYNEAFRYFVLMHWSQKATATCLESRISPCKQFRSQVYETGVIQFALNY